MVLTRVSRATSAHLSLLSLSLCAGTSLGEPLGAIDQNPLLSGYALPGLFPAGLDAAQPWAVATQYSWSNSAIAQSSARETLIVDAETRELRLKAQRTFTNGYAVRIELPHRTVTAGDLDGFIDEWHDVFGLPEGAHSAFEEDSLRLLYRRDGVNLLNSDASSSGIGDISIAVGREFANAESHTATVWLGANVPTGAANDFLGSGSFGFTAAVSSAYRSTSFWSVYGQLAGSWLGEGDRLPGQQRNWAASGTVGVTARASDALTLTLQFDAHTQVFDTDDLDFLGDAVMVSVGGAYRFPSLWTVSLGLTEDIAVESTTDVVFLFELRKSW